MTAEQTCITEMLTQSFSERFCNRIINVIPARGINRNYAVVKSRLTVKLPVAGKSRSADIICGFIAENSGVFIREVNGILLNLLLRKLSDILPFKPLIL